eukprot:m.67575 g.67575  ORF g.67575 m.67575 type:complete len:434 (+) comp23836_c0_seq1:309-1610(+)
MDSLLKIGEPGPAISADGTVLTRDPQDASWEDEEDPQLDLCGLCETQGSRYTCPRCKIRYCSLTCYKGERHAECSEGFYKEEFMEAMKHKVSDPKERQEMAAILRKFEDEQVEEADPSSVLEVALAERIQGLSLDNEDDAAAIWERLTPREQSDFNNKRKLASLLVQWTPWWVDAGDNKHMIEEVGDDDDEYEGDTLARREPADVPEMEKDIPLLSSLLRGKPPAKELIYNSLDLIYTYVYMCLRYNGDIDELFTAQECSEAILSISGVLGNNACYRSTTEALQSVFSNIQQQQPLFVSPEYSAQVLTDLMQVIENIRNVGVALSHLFRIVAQAASNKAPTLVPDAKTARKQVKLAKKKLEFYLSWWSWLASTENDSHENMGGHLFEMMSSEIAREQNSMQRDLSEVNEGKRALEKNWNGKRPPPRSVLIQEL